jgi:hypothetical protein
MHYCVLGASNLATVDEAGGTVDGVGGGDELTADGGNCRDILVASSVCKPWRELVCFHPGLLKDLRFTVNEARWGRRCYHSNPRAVRNVYIPIIYKT